MKTKSKGKEKKKQVLPGIELGTFRTPGRFVLRHVKHTPKFVIIFYQKPFP